LLKLGEDVKRNKSTLIKAWQKNELMPGAGYSFTASDAERLSSDKIDRDAFLGMMKMLSEMVRGQSETYRKKHRRGQQEDQSRGGWAR
jgi:hypothetical protein